MSQLTFLEKEDNKLVNLKEASEWASQYLNRKITVSNISYLLQYGRIKKHGNNGGPLLSKEELKDYYDSFNKEKQWKKILGEDIDWHLSFVEYKEAERTKHVHRLHPYKGKFIPQLAEYFLNSHTDEFKKEAYFHKGDIVLDPFCGSGTTLVQANELGIHAIGIDISSFNAMITNVKVEKHNLPLIAEAARKLTSRLKDFQQTRDNIIFEKHLLSELAKILLRQKIRGVFSSPPYVGLIDYHEQHAYAYEIFGFERKDKLEIGPLFKGQGKEARDSYIQGIADVLKNCKKYLQNNYDIFLVANDKFNLYPKIAELSNMKIINKFKRPVLNRVEKDRDSAYAETIFHLKES